MSDADLITIIPEEEYQRQQRRNDSHCKEIWGLLDAVKDPEIPVLSLWEMGILQDVVKDGERVIVTITPTYSGCPAMTAMAEDVVVELEKAGYECDVVSRLSPAWSTTWMSEKSREKLRDWGIAPPSMEGNQSQPAVACPNCGSTEVQVISEFGSTACKALYRCKACSEPFDYFKSI